MFKVVLWRYGNRMLIKSKTYEEALEDFDDSDGRSFTECILDENDVIINDGFKSVLGRGNSREGQIYKFD